jgi:hypothetical protein
LFGIAPRKANIPALRHERLVGLGLLWFLGGGWFGFLGLYLSRLSFFGWLLENLLKWGYESNGLCLFCRSCIESRAHPFFHCGFSRRLWKEVMSCNLISDPQVLWKDVVVWGEQELKGKRFEG